MDLLRVDSHDGTRIAAHISGPVHLFSWCTAPVQITSTTWRLVGPMFEEQ